MTPAIRATIKDLTKYQRAVYDELVRAVEAGEACPTNAALGTLVGNGHARGRELVEALIRKGLIRINQSAWPRRVTILATGAQSAATAKQPRPVVELVRTGLPDSPCFMCGDRGWCSHRREAA